MVRPERLPGDLHGLPVERLGLLVPPGVPEQPREIVEAGRILRMVRPERLPAPISDGLPVERLGLLVPPGGLSREIVEAAA